MNSPRFIPPPRDYDGYIFDCDGTLADTMPLHFFAWRHALQSFGAPFEFSWSLFTRRAGMSLEETVSELEAEFRFRLDPEAVAAAQREYFRELEHHVLPVPEVLAFARGLESRAPLSVASGSLRPNVERTLVQIGARELFPVIVTPEAVERGKPHPDMFLLAAQQMGVDPSRCLVIEDAELGFEAARRAKMAFAVVSSEPPPGF